MAEKNSIITQQQTTWFCHFHLYSDGAVRPKWNPFPSLKVLSVLWNLLNKMYPNIVLPWSKLYDTDLPSPSARLSTRSTLVCTSSPRRRPHHRRTPACSTLWSTSFRTEPLNASSRGRCWNSSLTATWASTRGTGCRQAPRNVRTRCVMPSSGQSGHCVCFRPYRAISIMREARSKLRLIKPDDMDMDEYLVLSHTSASPSVLNKSLAMSHWRFSSGNTDFVIELCLHSEPSPNFQPLFFFSTDDSTTVWSYLSCVLLHSNGTTTTGFSGRCLSTCSPGWSTTSMASRYKFTSAETFHQRGCWKSKSVLFKLH